MNNNFMNEALKQAEKAYEKDEVPVGAVIVKDNVIVAKAYNKREEKLSSLAHAEIECINKACKKLKTWRLENCEMYVTLEPCAMCAGAITQARIKKVYIGAKDKKNGCVGSIDNILEINTTHKVEYEYIDGFDECSGILTRFFSKLRKEKK